jgi:hypothetical protein
VNAVKGYEIFREKYFPKLLRQKNILQRRIDKVGYCVDVLPYDVSCLRLAGGKAGKGNLHELGLEAKVARRAHAQACHVRLNEFCVSYCKALRTKNDHFSGSPSVVEIKRMQSWRLDYYDSINACSYITKSARLCSESSSYVTIVSTGACSGGTREWTQTLEYGRNL